MTAHATRLAPILRSLAGLALVLASLRTPGGECRVVIPDVEIRCPYHALDPSRHDVVFTDLSSDYTLRAASVERPNDPRSDLIFDSLRPDSGWVGMATFFSPDLERAIVMRFKPGCPGYEPTRAGLPCSYGRTIVWLAYHDRRTAEWVHVNLAARGPGRNAEAHGWSTWLRSDLALFNGLFMPDEGISPREPQICAVRFRSDEDFTVEPFAPARLWRDDCLTGRVNAQAPRAQNRCFDGQRITFVRRCQSEAITGASHAWWNTASADGTGSRCVPQAERAQVPVLRTYVAEVDGDCQPKASFEDLRPVHEPYSDPIYKQMGEVPEWGEMLSSISPDGQFVAFAANMGDPRAPEDNCAGFRLNLDDPANPMSGQSNRNTHVCRLDSSRQCGTTPFRLPTSETPPESTPLPSFVAVNGETRYIVLSRRWSQFGAAPFNDVVAYDLRASLAIVPLAFGHNAVAITPVLYVPPPDRRRAMR